MHGFAGGVCSGAAWMPDRVRHDNLNRAVIAGLTRNPCIDGQRISGVAWIAGQARNDSRGSVVDFDATHDGTEGVPRATWPRGAVQLHAALPSPDKKTIEPQHLRDSAKLIPDSSGSSPHDRRGSS